MAVEMDAKTRRARLIQREIADVLRRNWDPIGIKDAPEAQDEYDAYVGGVYRLLESGATVKELAAHLIQLETDKLGENLLNIGRQNRQLLRTI